MMVAAAGCGTSSKSQQTSIESSGGSGHSYKPGSRRMGDDDDEEAPDGLSLDNEHGVLESEDVEAVLERNFPAFTRCYGRAGEAQRYVEGQVLLRIFVSGTGAVTDAHVVENTLGNFAIERCLVVEARAIKFPAPKGRKPTEFEYPLQFRSTRETALVDWPDATIPSEVIDAMAAMQPCAPLAEAPVETILYIEPSGSVGSAGFSAGGALDAEAAMCALEQMRGWRLKGEPGHVLRTRFDLRVPAVGAAAAPAPAAPLARGRKLRARRR